MTVVGNKTQERLEALAGYTTDIRARAEAARGTDREAELLRRMLNELTSAVNVEIRSALVERKTQGVPIEMESEIMLPVTVEYGHNKETGVQDAKWTVLSEGQETDVTDLLLGMEQGVSDQMHADVYAAHEEWENTMRDRSGVVV